MIQLPGIEVGDRCTVDRHTHGLVARVMAVAEGYAMLRYKGCVPFVAPIAELRKTEGQP